MTRALFRKLGPTDAALYREHLCRLGPTDRASRFGPVSSSASPVRGFPPDALVIGGFVEGRLRAVGELHRLEAVESDAAEAAFSVEPHFQDCGLGRALLERLGRAARNRGVERLVMLCNPDNARMLRMAETAGAKLAHDAGQVWATLRLPPANAWTQGLEAIEDAMALAYGAAELGCRVMSRTPARAWPTGGDDGTAGAAGAA